MGVLLLFSDFFFFPFKLFKVLLENNYSEVIARMSKEVKMLMGVTSFLIRQSYQSAIYICYLSEQTPLTFILSPEASLLMEIK